MTTYAIAHLQSVTPGKAIAEYLQRIDATLERFGGTFVVHGATPLVLEGEVPGHLIVIAFPGREEAQRWYDSPDYREILPLRLENSTGWAALVEGVEPGHRATDLLG